MTILLTIKRPKIESDSTNLGEFSLGIKFRSNVLVDQEVQELEVAESLLLLGKQRSKFTDNNARKKKLKLVCGSHYFPKDNPERPRGEDAYFVSEEAQTIGVADGVGKWASRGVDAGEYARELMTNAFFSADKIRRDHVNFEEKNNNNENPRKRKRMAVDVGMDIMAAVDPKRVLGEAYAETKKKLALQGSSTVCILSLDAERGVLHSANVGDSGYMVFRGGKRMYASPTMQHKFNCPYQLGNGQGGTRDDGPNSAMVFELPGVMQGDIIVMGTDGLLDNIHPEQIEELLEATADCKGYARDDREYCQGLAETLAEIALENSMNVDFDSPFAREANKAGLAYSGGKVDDITVIVAQVVCYSSGLSH